MPKPILLLETIKIKNGEISNLYYHQQRVNKSRQTLYKMNDILDISKHIIAPEKGLYRCRVIYHTHIHAIEYIPYTPKTIQSLKIVPTQLEYALKYLNRVNINALVHTHQNFDDILFEKNGYICDTSIANIAFFDGIQWVTPKNPLLPGTMRSKLLEEGFLIEKNIRKEALSSYSQVALMNAMIGFKILKNIEIHNTQGIIYDY